MLLSLLRKSFLFLSCLHVLSNSLMMNKTSIIQLQGEHVAKIISARLIPPLLSNAYKGISPFLFICHLLLYTTATLSCIHVYDIIMYIRACHYRVYMYMTLSCIYISIYIYEIIMYIHYHVYIMYLSLSCIYVTMILTCIHVYDIIMYIIISPF
jgi:hypothetical protein